MTNKDTDTIKLTEFEKRVLSYNTSLSDEEIQQLKDRPIPVEVISTIENPTPEDLAFIETVREAMKAK